MAKKNSPVHITGDAFAAQPTAAKIKPTKAKTLRLAAAYFVSLFIKRPVALCMQVLYAISGIIDTHQRAGA